MRITSCSLEQFWTRKRINRSSPFSNIISFHSLLCTHLATETDTMSSNSVNQEYQVCPECDKSFKHLIPHLRNKHAWDVADIFDFKTKQSEKLPAYDEIVDESQFTARKVSEVELEVEAKARREVDKAVMMYALAEMNTAIRDMYRKIESSTANITMEAASAYARAGGDVIDGPRRDSTRRVREILEPSCEYLRECVTHEMCRISGELKRDITSIL